MKENPFMFKGMQINSFIYTLTIDLDMLLTDHNHFMYT